MKMLIEQLTGTAWDKPLSRPRQLSIILHSSTRESQCVKKASQAYFGLPAFLTWIVHCFRGYAETTALFPCIDRPAAVCIRGSNNFNFNLRVFGKRGYLYCGTCWRVRFEIGAIKFVYRLEVGEVGQENGRLDDVSEIQSLCPEHGCDVFHYLPRLCINVAGNDFASLWIQGDLPGTKDEIARANCLRVRPDGSGRIGSRNDFLHAAMLAAASLMSSHCPARSSFRSAPTVRDLVSGQWLHKLLCVTYNLGRVPRSGPDWRLRSG